MIKILAFIIILISPVIIFAKPVIDSKIVHYDIYPNSKKDIERALFAKTPIILDGRKYLGVTNWKIDLKYEILETSNFCKAVNVKTIAQITIVLPRIPKEEKASYNIKSSFKRFYNKVKKHELKHEYYVIKATKEIDKKIQQSYIQTNCKKLKKKFDKYVDQIIKKYNKKNKSFDEKTKRRYNNKANIDSYL